MRIFYDIFMHTLKIPLKNIWRNRRRTFLTMAGITVATLCLILFGGYIRVMETGMMENAIAKEFGHFQIARTGYFDADSTSSSHLIPKEEFRLIEDTLYKMEDVDYVNLRLHLAGIIGHIEASTVFFGICGQPETEIFMSPSVIKGEPISATDPGGIIIGAGMAQKLDVDVGSNLLLFFSSDSGAQEAINVNVRGLYKGILKEQENMMIHIPIESAWDLMLERKVHRILVFLEKKDDLLPAMEQVKAVIAGHNLALEVKPWHELAVYYQQIIGMFTGMLLVIALIFGIIVVFNISNTMYMVMNERTREIGTLRAIGKGRFEIMRLMMLEGLFMGIIGVTIGIVLALVLIPSLNSLQLTLPPGPGQDEPIPIHIMVDLIVIMLVGIGTVGVTLWASILPAFKATRLNIVDALRYV